MISRIALWLHYGPSREQNTRAKGEIAMPPKSITLLFSVLTIAGLCVVFCCGFWNASTAQASEMGQLGIHLDQVTGVPSKVPRRFPSGTIASAAGASAPGTVQVIVILNLPSAAEVGAALRNSPSIPESLVNLAVQYEVTRLRQLQQQLIAQLTGPEIGATLIGQTQTVGNMIFIQVDSRKLDLIRKLPGVAAVRITKPLRQNLPSVGPVHDPPVTNGADQNK
jgi:hypothetical protein